jgi:hypothetical protein
LTGKILSHPFFNYWLQNQPAQRAYESAQTSGSPLFREEYPWAEHPQPIKTVPKKIPEIRYVKGEKNVRPSNCAEEDRTIFRDGENGRTIKCKHVGLDE